MGGREFGELLHMWQYVETHIRSGESRQMLVAYYHQLIHMQHRFCTDGTLPGVKFKWCVNPPVVLPSRSTRFDL